MTKRCSVCERMIHDGDKVVAVVLAVFHEIDSKRAYAIEKPTECYELRHSYCEGVSDE